MRKIKNQMRVLVDVDDTLVRSPHKGDAGCFEVDYYGMTKKQVAIQSNIQLLIAFKRRGYEITVHSANGVEWAETIVNKLELVEYVDWVATKPTGYVDDRDANDWMQRIFVEE